ncbi:MAG: glycosyltransferase family A protein [Bacillota bacterium]|nr:glycosyltransferase family A protein [Bacillota bacterium]
MFLSVIVSCHNCKDTIEKVLRSILNQNFESVEVIISDDHSTDGFMEVVKKYNKLLDIKHYKTKKHKYHCPGNTRLDGLAHATGDWIAFIDHDDVFLPGAFNCLKQSVDALSEEIKDNVPLFFSPIQKASMQDVDEGILTATTWLHGNFYKRSFLIENSINFKEDLFGNEDLYFNNFVYGVIAGKQLTIMQADKPLYKWYTNPKSLSNSRMEGSDVEYTEKYFADYVYANSVPHFECAKRFPEQIEYFQHEVVKALILSYFYYQRALYSYKSHPILQEMKDSIVNFIKQSCANFNWSLEDLKTKLTENGQEFSDVRAVVCSLSGSFIEQQSITDFIQALYYQNI